MRKVWCFIDSKRLDMKSFIPLQVLEIILSLREWGDKRNPARSFRWLTNVLSVLVHEIGEEHSAGF